MAADAQALPGHEVAPGLRGRHPIQGTAMQLGDTDGLKFNFCLWGSRARQSQPVKNVHLKLRAPSYCLDRLPFCWKYGQSLAL